MFKMKTIVTRQQQNKKKKTSIVPGQYGHLHSSTGGVTGTGQVNVNRQFTLTILQSA